MIVVVVALAALATPTLAATPAATASATAICVVEPSVNGISAEVSNALFDTVTLEIEELGVQILDPPRVTQRHGKPRNLNSAWCQAAAAETPRRVLGILRMTIAKREAEARIDLEFVELQQERVLDASRVTASPEKFMTAPLLTRALAHGLLALQGARAARSDSGRPSVVAPAISPNSSSAASAPATAAAPASTPSGNGGLIGTAISLTGATALAAGTICALAAVVTYQQLDWLSRDFEGDVYALDRSSYAQLVLRYQVLWWSALSLTALGTTAALGGGAVVVYDRLTGPAAGATAAGE